jgi:hypothetical protein
MMMGLIAKFAGLFGRNQPAGRPAASIIDTFIFCPDPDPDPSPPSTSRMPIMAFLPHDPDALAAVEQCKAAVLAEKCPCPEVPRSDPAAAFDPHKVGAVAIPAFLLPLAEQAIAQFGPAVLSYLEQAGQKALEALVAKLHGGGGPPGVAPGV